MFFSPVIAVRVMCAQASFWFYMGAKPPRSQMLVDELAEVICAVRELGFSVELFGGIQ